MVRLRLLFALGLFAGSASLAPAQWATIKGTVVYPAAVALPIAKPVNVTTDQAHCLSKGPLVDDTIEVNKKNRGLKNVFVYLKAATDAAEGAPTFAAEVIHPDLLKAKPVERVIDQPCCTFIPRALAAREGDTLLIKNSSPVNHNINFASDALSFNQNVVAGGSFTAPNPLSAQKGVATFACNVHPWMAGRAMIFDHPYFAVTDEDGKFEIANAPVGKFRIFYRHQEGYHSGRAGAKGFPVPIAAGKDGKTMEMDPLEFVIVAK